MASDQDCKIIKKKSDILNHESVQSGTSTVISDASTSATLVPPSTVSSSSVSSSSSAGQCYLPPISSLLHEKNKVMVDPYACPKEEAAHMHVLPETNEVIDPYYKYYYTPPLKLPAPEDEVKSNIKTTAESKKLTVAKKEKQKKPFSKAPTVSVKVKSHKAKSKVSKKTSSVNKSNKKMVHMPMIPYFFHHEKFGIEACMLQLEGQKRFNHYYYI